MTHTNMTHIFILTVVIRTTGYSRLVMCCVVSLHFPQSCPLKTRMHSTHDYTVHQIIAKLWRLKQSSAHWIPFCFVFHGCVFGPRPVSGGTQHTSGTQLSPLVWSIPREGLRLKAWQLKHVCRYLCFSLPCLDSRPALHCFSTQLITGKGKVLDQCH